MKKFFTLAIAVVATLMANAQNPADWKIGQNVAAELGLGDVDGTSFSGTTSASTDDNRPHDLVIESLGNYWKCDGALPNEFREPTDDCCGIIGFYDRQNADIYQVVKFPAGSYTIDVQALYREGTPADNFTNHFNKKYIKNGHLYADVIASEDPQSEVSRSFDKVLCSLATANQNEELYNYGDGSWMNDYKHDVKDPETGEVTSYYCPQCLTGLGQYFAAGKYHNTMKLVLPEDAYIRIGFRKTGFIQADWLVFTNLQVIYDGEATEAAKVEQAKEEVVAAISNLEDLQLDVDATGFSAFAGLVGDDVMYAYEDMDAAEDVATLDALLVSINAKIDNYRTTVSFAKNLSDLINMSTDVIASTEFPGFNQFKAAFDKAVAEATTEDVDALDGDPAAYYQNIYKVLSKERADYLNSGPADENGAKDFTSLVKNPWFVAPQYNPTQNEDGTWTLKEGGWADWGGVCGQFGSPKAYREIDLNARSLVDICEGVVLNPSDDVTNQWYRKNAYSGWSAGLALMYHSGLVGVSDGWNSLASGTIGIEQQLVGLPNGYYSLKALVRGNNGDVNWDGKNREIYAINSNGEAVYSETVKNDSDRPICAQYGWYEWNPNAWAEVETSIISALDGQLKIGGRCSKVANFTGFRLFFYGEDLDFTSKLQEYLDKLTPQLEDLVFAGDKKAVQDILNNIVLPIPDKDAYEVAFAYFNEAKNALDVALAGEKAYTASNTFAELVNKYDFVEPAFEKTINFGEKETDTYEAVANLNDIAAAYKDYCEVYDKAVALDDDDVNKVIAKQTAELSAEMVEKEVIFAYLDNLALPYNTALLKAAGAAEATEANPTDITSILVNPSFNDDPTKGWSGATPTNNEFAYDENGVRTNAELWNASAFTLSQKLVGLPAGTYEIRVKAIYRDATAVTQALVDNYNTAGNEEKWSNHNAQLFAKTSDENDQFSYIKAIESLKTTETSFRYVVTAWGEDDGLYAEKVTAITGDPETITSATYSFADEGAYPFDTKVGDYYYPASMQGFYQWCVKNPEAVSNKVQITIENGETLELGIRKTAAISQDWVIFDDFELYYLSGETFKQISTAITEVNAAVNNDAIFNIAGQRISAPQKGINIMNGKKIYVK